MKVLIACEESQTVFVAPRKWWTGEKMKITDVIVGRGIHP